MGMMGAMGPKMGWMQAQAPGLMQADLDFGGGGGKPAGGPSSAGMMPPDQTPWQPGGVNIQPGMITGQGDPGYGVNITPRMIGSSSPMGIPMASPAPSVGLTSGGFLPSVGNAMSGFGDAAGQIASNPFSASAWGGGAKAISSLLGLFGL